MHNLYTLRGAKVRDALRWSGYIDEMIQLFGESETVFASHHWPIHGNERIIDYLKKQRDTYKFIHDQTLRLANAGYTPREIAEQLTLPPSLAESFPNRGYYGTLRHNSKAVYQGYFGWYDGNPANLDPLPPEPAAKKYVEAMGGRASVLAKAQDAYEKGDYRWASMLLDHLVFAAPDDEAARELLAASYDQLGYQAALARRLPDRRPRAAPRHHRQRDRHSRGGERAARDVGGPLLRRDGDTAERTQGRRHEPHAQLHLHGPR
jgi:alkyl sulfatase BDS1-like metallo-beta-lactamase superfamily hydrolase